jgi:hypothetical protein
MNPRILSLTFCRESRNFLCQKNQGRQNEGYCNNRTNALRRALRIHPRIELQSRVFRVLAFKIAIDIRDSDLSLQDLDMPKRIFF